MARLTPYQRIMRNADRGMGVELSAAEVAALSMDDAISTRAELETIDAEEQRNTFRAIDEWASQGFRDRSRT